MSEIFVKITPPVFLKTKRLTITDFTPSDKAEYFRRYMDDELNRWWGYDYREDLKEKPPTPEYFYSFMQSLKEKGEEYSFALRKEENLIGELVLYNFEEESCEMGFRLFLEHQGNGYAFEGASALKEYAFNALGAKKLKAKCYKENLPSKKLIEKLGFKFISEDNTHFYFECEKVS